MSQQKNTKKSPTDVIRRNVLFVLVMDVDLCNEETVLVAAKHNWLEENALSLEQL